MEKADILPIGYPPLFCSEAQERRSATRSQPPCASPLIVALVAHFWSTGPLHPPPKRPFPAPICARISVFFMHDILQPIALLCHFEQLFEEEVHLYRCDGKVILCLQWIEIVFDVVHHAFVDIAVSSPIANFALLNDLFNFNRHIGQQFFRGHAFETLQGWSQYTLQQTKVGGRVLIVVQARRSALIRALLCLFEHVAHLIEVFGLAESPGSICLDGFGNELRETPVHYRTLRDALREGLLETIGDGIGLC